MRRSVFVNRVLAFFRSNLQHLWAKRGEPHRNRKATVQELPFPLPGKVFFARRRRLSRSRLLLARTLTAGASSHTIAVRGMGADPLRSPAVSGSIWSSLRLVALCLARRFCLSPRFYPHLSGPAGPLPDGVPRFGGALLSPRRSRVDQDAERSQPHSDGYALLRCQSVFPFLHATMFQNCQFKIPASILLPGFAPVLSRRLLLAVPQRFIFLPRHP